MMKLRNGLGLALFVSAILSTTAWAFTEKAKMPGSVGAYSPCSGQLVSTAGNLLLEVATNPDSSITVKLQYKGLGADEDGVTFKAEINGEETFGSFSSPFAVPYSGTFAGKPPAESFTVDGFADVYVDGNGVPTGAAITSLNATCVG